VATLRKNNTEKYLRHFAENVIKRGKQILRAKGKEGKLSDSLKYRLEATSKGYNLIFKGADYATFVDKGVSGTKTTRTYHNVFGKRERSPFKYKAGVGNSPNIGALAKWISRKGIKGRDKETGRFIKTKSLAMLFSKSIQREGLKSSSFFSKPMSIELAKFDNGILEAFKTDILTHFETIEL
tara:strand:+ start:170 stop:715 length:546 start_codon:yes stop_codon:yes gene_type:complete